MNRLYTISVIISFVVLSKCASQRKTEYDIPSHVPPENKALLIARAEKGKVLYKTYCSGCHGIFTKGKDGIPNFTKMQIDNYNAMFIKGDPKNHSVARKLSQDQLNYILTFLRLRKMNK